MAEIKIMFEPTEKDPYAIIYKPADLPSAPLNINDDCALNQLLKYYPQLKSVTGKKDIEYGLIHRIDTITRGLLLIASTQSSYDNFIQQQKNGTFIKFYRATVDYSNPKQNNQFSISSRFRTFGPKGREVRPVFEDSSVYEKKKASQKIYTTNITIVNHKAYCSIKEGFRHQVRCHLSYSGYPIKGDFLYNKNAKEKDIFDFEAYKLEFLHPVSGKKIIYEV